ncbi:hypothetical protein [Acetobacter aceti]|uniref:hypothetical protein n=1 Tax=Acetobacter aceti TaxID=435 RepID=UPI0002FECED7|nr:hypothetical protein [Acetobacter aceti]
MLRHHVLGRLRTRRHGIADPLRRNLANETEAGLMGMGFGALGTGSGLCAAAFSLLARHQAASFQSAP